MGFCLWMIVCVAFEASANEKDDVCDTKLLEANDDLYMRAEELFFDEETKIYTAIRQVEIVYMGRRLTADKVTYNMTTGGAEASGNIVLTDLGEKTHLFADYISLDKDFSFGVAKAVSARRGQYLKIAAKKVVRKNEDITEFYDTVYTPCGFKGQKSPLWQIRADKVTDDSKTQDVYYDNPTLEILGTPALSLPFFTYPRPTVERRSGILPPEVAIDTNNGVGVTTPYFYEISQDKNMTLAPRFYSENNPLWQSGYKQRTDKGYYKAFTAFTSSDMRNENGVTTDDRKFRGTILSSGRSEISQDSGWGFDINRTTDDTFLNRFDISGTNYLQSRLFYEYDDKRTSLFAGGYAFQDLNGVVDDDSIPVILPYIDYNHKSRVKPFGGNLNFSGNIAATYRKDGMDTRRVVTKTHWTKDYELPAGLLFTFENLVRADVYHTSGGVDPGDATNIIENGLTARAVPMTAGKLALPLIKKTKNATHLLEPSAQIVVAPYGGNSNKIPNEDGYAAEFDAAGLFDLQRFYGYDLIEDGPRLNTGMRYMYHEPEKGGFEAQFGRSYRLKEDTRFPEYSGLSGKKSDYVGRFVANYKDYIHLTHRYRMDNVSDGLNMSDLTLDVGNDRFRLGVSYFNVDDYTNTSIFENSEQFNTAARFSLTKHWHVTGGYRQNLDTNATLETRGAILYTDECFITEISLGREYLRYRDIEPETTLRLRVKLLSLGNNAFLE